MTTHSIGIMQPYFLPYIGYFQLMAMVDKFVVFDDVNFIQRGWINRNRLLMNGAPYTFTIPLSHASQNKLICDTHIAETNWQPKLLRTIEQAYIKAPQFPQVFELCHRIILCNSSSLSAFVLNSLRLIANYLNLQVTIIPSSKVYGNNELCGQERILDICHMEKATAYVNLIGGVKLYEQQRFHENGIKLFFLRSQNTEYRQFSSLFVSSLSILDVMMFNDVASIKSHLKNYDLISASELIASEGML